MQVIADTHVHFYPCYDLGKAFETAFAGLRQLGGAESFKVLVLAERHDCHFFRNLMDGAIDLSKAGFQVWRTVQDGALIVKESRKDNLLLLAGRQIITREKLEVLALTTDAAIPDGMHVYDALEAIRRVGGVPVLGWAPGKWFGRRGRVVRELIQKGPSDSFVLSDTTLRPTLWPEPFLMREALERGFQVIAGSDPLPFAGEERWIGSYGISFDGPFDPGLPADACRKLLTGAAGATRRVGKRNGLLTVLGRLKKNYQARK